jgi:ubiquinone/menaquinone biosynthesis C-methylase UbiE
MPSFISFIPTPFEDINGFFDLVPLTASDVVYDLGSGDGRLLFAAIEKGAGRAVGVELNPAIVQQARETALSKGLEERITFLQADIMEVNLADATVVLCYLFTSACTALKPKFERELKTGTRVVMESFTIPGWNPVKIQGMGYKYFYLYVMPPVPTKQGERNYAPYDYYGYYG